MSLIIQCDPFKGDIVLSLELSDHTWLMSKSLVEDIVAAISDVAKSNEFEKIVFEPKNREFLLPYIQEVEEYFKDDKEIIY